MARRIRISPSADADLDRVIGFLQEGSQAAAENAYDRLIEGMRLLSEFPYLGIQLRGTLRRHIIRFGRSAYVMHYRVSDDEILITRIWHGRENRPR